MRPWKETLRNAQELLSRSVGNVEIFQQFSCTHCLHKNTMAEANTFFTLGYCDRCDHLTNIEEAGCDFAVVVSRPKLRTAIVSDQVRSQPDPQPQPRSNSPGKKQPTS